MKVEVITDVEFIARIQARSERAPERDVPGGIECWREYGVEHFFLNGAYLHSIPFIPVAREWAESNGTLDYRARPAFDPTDKALVNLVRTHIAELTDDERHWFFSAVLDGYCPHCWRPNYSGHCSCLNDE